MTVEIQVHPDLAGTAEGQEIKGVVGAVGAGRGRCIHVVVFRS
jgi:hypothetical protein